MKTKILTYIICCLALFSACDKDGNLIRVTGIGSSELMLSETDVVLSKATSSSSVLALTWSKSELSISDPSMSLPTSVPSEVIEVSATTGFTTFITITPTSNTYTFFGVALNTLAKNLGFTAGESKPMYFRIRTALGDNTEPHYSPVNIVNVTCYSIDMSLGFILDSKKVDTGFKLYSKTSNGEYYGFTGSGAWANWFLLEGDGTTWGNLPVDGNAFALSSADDSWNFWYPGQSGCYYTSLSTTNKEWTATYIPTLSVSGDITAEMTFDKLAVKWYVSFTTTSDNVSIKVSTDGAKLYNKTTSTDDAAAVAKTIGFIPASDSTLTFDWNSASAGNITIPKAGDYTLTFYLSDPTKWTYQIKSGKTVVIKPLSKKLFLLGADDNIVPGDWNFNRYLQLVNEDDSTFAGAVLIDSKWGYQMTLDSGEWTNIYQKGATDNTLGYKSGTNIPAPTAGLYLMQADLKNLTYSNTAITGLSYAGLNAGPTDSWNMVSMNETSITGVYSGELTITAISAWGIKLYVNGNWSYPYGGTDGVLQYSGSKNIVDDATVGVGTFDLIADIRNNSYVFLGNEIYIAGLNDLWDFTNVVLSKTSSGVYTGTATITKQSKDGIQIHLDKTWSRFYGGSFSSLKYKGSNITDDQSLAVGTYTVTVDFINNTCSFVAN